MYEHDRIKNAFFNGMHRQVWAFGLAWLVYACAYGYAGKYYIKNKIIHGTVVNICN